MLIYALILFILSFPLNSNCMMIAKWDTRDRVLLNLRQLPKKRSSSNLEDIQVMKKQKIDRKETTKQECNKILNDPALAEKYTAADNFKLSVETVKIHSLFAKTRQNKVITEQEVIIEPEATLTLSTFLVGQKQKKEIERQRNLYGNTIESYNNHLRSEKLNLSKSVSRRSPNAATLTYNPPFNQEIEYYAQRKVEQKKQENFLKQQKVVRKAAENKAGNLLARRNKEKKQEAARRTQLQSCSKKCPGTPMPRNLR